MLFTDRDIFLMRLAGWCKNIPQETAGIIATPAELKALESFGYLSAGTTLRLRPAGYRLLQRLGWDYPQDTKYRSDDITIANRLDAAKIVYLCYRAGINPFISTPANLREASVYLPSFAVRRNKSLSGNLFHGSRFSGILRADNTAFLVINVDSARDKMYYASELNLFHNIISPLGLERSAIICVSHTYESVYTRLTVEPPAQEKASRRNDAVSYAEMYRRSHLPVHLVSFDDTGAKQLMIMAREDYLSRIAEASMSGLVEKPAYCDGIMNGVPLIVAVDMDLNRIDRCIETAKRENIPRIAIAALRGQITGLLSRLYRDKAMLYEITRGIIRRAFPDTDGLCSAERTPFIMPDGRMLDVSDF